MSLQVGEGQQRVTARWDKCIERSIIYTFSGATIGALSFFVFKSKFFRALGVGTGTGLGSGFAYGWCRGTDLNTTRLNRIAVLSNSNQTDQDETTPLSTTNVDSEPPTEEAADNDNSSNDE
eukprot:TRINITY_DN1630_c0_g1_i1.p1 TRINITY_DN1630_c0_g1~~TRINITY_DN1630_c0_g1_i1.p1  ORF type:complete len:121 (-),score=22.54 TRINITY_DN1630_c0_g1_i1:117-479(-)